MPSAEQDILQFGPHRLDRRSQQLWTGTRPVALQPKAWALLMVLLERPGILVSTDELLNALWPQDEVTHKALTNRIAELRKALGDDARAPRLIQTVHRRGYRLLAEVQPGATPHAPSPAPAPAHHTAWAPASLAGRAVEQAALARH